MLLFRTISFFSVAPADPMLYNYPLPLTLHDVTLPVIVKDIAYSRASFSIKLFWKSSTCACFRALTRSLCFLIGESSFRNMHWYGCKKLYFKILQSYFSNVIFTLLLKGTLKSGNILQKMAKLFKKNLKSWTLKFLHNIYLYQVGFCSCELKYEHLRSRSRCWNFNLPWQERSSSIWRSRCCISFSSHSQFGVRQLERPVKSHEKETF